MTQNDRWAHLKEHVNNCPFYRHLGFRVVDLDEGFARLAMPASPELFQFQGAVHGGAIYSVADAAVAVALLTVSEPDEKALTIEGKVNFLAPVTGGEVIAEGRIVHKGRSIALGDVDVRRASDGRLVAKGLVTYTLRR
ncbi:MAG: PaaI family thioesterase [Chloroflexi bacterium]|nr:PaaI family thioesterase [Chloroflexota bacterium]